MNLTRTTNAGAPADVDVVVIGRNEGDRLRRCLLSIEASAAPLRARVIYVDSGSADGSVALARGLGAEVVELDMSLPFTAARGRNAGFVRATAPLVQFVDGDCELRQGWIAAGAAELAAHPEAVVVFGRLRERFPERSIYNRLSDLEWETLVGEAPFCGGIAMMRTDAVRAVGGFDESIVAGEEPELCARLRTRGGAIRSVAAEMCFHDAAMTRLGQWWRRQSRSGFGMAEVTFRLWRSGQRCFVRPLLSAAAWGVAWPVVLVVAFGAVLAGWAPWWAPAAVAASPVVAGARIALGARRRGLSGPDALAYAGLTLLSKPAIALGAARRLVSRGGGAGARGAFHKDAGAAAAPGADRAPARAGAIR